MSHPDFALAESVSTTNASYFIFVYILILIYCCFGLAVVCDVYFVPALQKLSYTYDLPPDIAGSTLMALGASVPELFASLIGVFITEDDIGTGSIIGSSCFNLIAVPAACAFVASACFTTKLTISPMPVIRNSAFYAITILVLLLIIKDNKVDILEACILLLFFVMYMALMIFSAQVKSLSDSFHSSLTSSYSSTDSAIAECNGSEKSKKHHNNNNNNSNNKNYHNNQQQATGSTGLVKDFDCFDNNGNGQQIYGNFYFSKDTNNNNNAALNERSPLVPYSNSQYYHRANYVNEYRLNLDDNRQAEAQTKQQDKDFKLNFDIVMKNSICLSNSNHHLTDSIDLLKRANNQNNNKSCNSNNNHNNELSFDSNCSEHDNWVSSKWILVPMLPLTLSMKVLTPCKFKNTCWTIWTFLVSIGLIGALTYVSVWMVHLFGQTIGIPETVAGMTILSWGTGIPELIASIVLIKKTAQADMAICNTIGSNVIDVSFCLSLPWIVKCIMNKTEGLKPEVEIQSSALPWTSFTLLLSVLLLILVFKLHNWTLSFSVGIWLMIVYVTFVVSATYLEYSFSETGLDLMSLF